MGVIDSASDSVTGRVRFRAGIRSAVTDMVSVRPVGVTGRESRFMERVKGQAGRSKLFRLWLGLGRRQSDVPGPRWRRRGSTSCAGSALGVGVKGQGQG